MLWGDDMEATALPGLRRYSAPEDGDLAAWQSSCNCLATLSAEAVLLEAAGCRKGARHGALNKLKSANGLLRT